MTTKALLFAVPALLFLFLAGCQNTMESTGESDSESRPDAALLRLQNESNMDFSSATVRFPEEEERFSALAAGEASDYRAFENAYSYGSVTVEAGGETYEVRAIDYMSETPLEPGRYTYHLDIDDGNLQVEFERN